MSSEVELRSSYASPDGRKVVVSSSVGVLFSDDFGGGLLDTQTRWDIFDGGLGAVTQSNGAQAAIGTGITGITDAVANSALTINMGTTASAERWYLSKKIFAGAEDILVVLSRSQALAANSIFVGLVEIDLATGYPVLNPSLAGDFNNRGGVEFGQTAGANTARVEAVADGSGAVATVTQAAFSNAAMTTSFETYIELHAEDIIASACDLDVINGRSANAMRVSTQCPNDGKPYMLILRFRNLSAPASNTSVVIQRLLVVDSQEARVEVASGRGDLNPQKAVAVNVVGAGATSANVQGATADNGSVASNPLLVGGWMSNALIAAGTTARLGRATMDLARRPIVKAAGIPQAHVFGAATLSNTTETVLVAANATQRLEVQTLECANKDTAKHFFTFRDTSAGSVRWVVGVPAGESRHVPFPAGLAASAVNQNFTVTLDATPTTTNPEVYLSGYWTTA